MKKEKPNKKDRKTDSYTVTEVGTLLEEVGTNVKRIAESHTGLDKRMEDIEVSNQGIKDRLNMIELGNSVIRGKVSRLEDACSKLLNDLKGTRQELGDTRQELKADITNLCQEFKTDITNLRVELKGDIKELGDRLSAAEARS